MKQERVQKKNLHIYGHLIFYKAAMANKRKKTFFSTNDAGTIKNNINPYFTPSTKTDSK